MKIAGVQCDVHIGQIERNVAHVEESIRESVQSGAKLVVFPECNVTGYCFASREDALVHSQEVPGPVTDQITSICNEVNCFAVVGMLERTDDTQRGETLYNVAVLIGPDGVLATHRKIHLPYLGVDRFTTHGDLPFEVHEAAGVNVGLMICYDGSFPESARCLSLLGADLIALPTNWPPGAECVVEAVIRSRALENGVYVIAVNRVGTEGGFRFIGGSQICDPSGRVLHLCSESNQEIFFADIDVERARRKHVIRVPEEHEIHRFADRRPEMYAPLVQPHFLPRPGRERAEQVEP